MAPKEEKKKKRKGETVVYRALEVGKLWGPQDVKVGGNASGMSQSEPGGEMAVG